MKYTFLNQDYVLEKDDDKIFNYDDVKEKITDYFLPFDYIFGDLAYNKIRFKGFYKSDSKNVKDINDIKNLDNYIKNYCSYGCKWFLLKKVQ